MRGHINLSVMQCMTFEICFGIPQNLLSLSVIVADNNLPLLIIIVLVLVVDLLVAQEETCQTIIPVYK